MATQVLTLRTAISSDIASIDRLLSQSYAKQLKASYPPSVQVTAIPIISRANPALITSGTYYLVESSEGRVMGAGGWTRSVKGPGIADVRHFVTDHRHTRQGMARRVMSGVMGEARRAGIHTLDCLATRNAVPFYEAMGFTSEGETKIGLRPGIEFPAVRMSRTL